MKTLLKKIIFVLILSLPSLIWAEEIGNQSISKEKLRYVSADNAGLKDKASIRAKDVYELVYAEVVVLEEEKGNWSFVSVFENPSVKGWVNSGVLSKRKIVANGRKRFVEADEIALAGKGLDKSLEDIQQSQEDVFSKDDLNLEEKNPIASLFKRMFSSEEEKNYFDYLAKVDESSVNSQELSDFIDEGKLILQEEE